MNLLGIGDDNLIIVKTNELGQMSVDDLDKKIKAALVMDKCPFFVNATAGTTVIGSFDDIDAIADVCQKYKLWLHVDVSLPWFLLSYNIYILICFTFSGMLGWQCHIIR